MQEGSWLTRHPVLADVCKALAVTGALALAAWVAHKVLPSSVQEAAWAWLSADRAWPVGILLVLVLATAAWPILGIAVLVRKRINRPMPYEAYRKDEFFGLRWRWKWNRGEALLPRSFCATCDLELDGRIVTEGASNTPTGELLYECVCGKTNIMLRAPNSVVLATTAARCAEREARKRGLLGD